MKNKIRILSTFLLVIFCLVLSSCSEDIYHGHSHDANGTDKHEVPFEQFKRETGIQEVELLKRVNFAGPTGRSVGQEFITDTTKILKYTLNDKVTYSLKIYPILEALESKEYYNLVYEKFGDQWNEIIFLNKEKEIQEFGESKLESSKMIYNSSFSISSMSRFCEAIHYSVQCDGSCSGECDGFACPTGQCIHESVSFYYCGGSLESDYLQITAPPTGGGGGGGNEYSGIFIPNPYSGEADLSNPDFMFSTRVAAFTRTLPADLKVVLENNFWLFPNIVEFMRNNGGLTEENKDTVVFALNFFKNFQQNLNLSNFYNESINKFKYWAFTRVLHHPDQETVDQINELKSLTINDTESDDNLLLFMMNSIDGGVNDSNIDENFLSANDELIDEDLAALNLSIGTDILVMHFQIQCAVLRFNHPDWSDLRVYWEASKEMLHITLDVFGLCPVVGEVADLTNGVLYTIEGDGMNASLSYANAIPVTGWVTVSTKYAFKLKQVSNITTKVKLTWKVVGNSITFGSRNQLRKVLGMAASNIDPRQAHHIIPWGKQGNVIVQKAAKSGNAFHMNEALNGIPLSTAVHNGSHAAYDNVIQSKFNLFNATNPNATPDECYDFLTDLINDVRVWIINNPNIPINNIVLP
jgi:hypothetical protein